MTSENQYFAYVLACADPAIKIPLTRYLDERFGNQNYFWLPKLGGVKNLISPDKTIFIEYMLEEIKEAANVHPFELIILINHSQCGKYKLAGITFDDPKKEETFHTDELTKAEVLLKKKFPKMAIERHYFLKDKQRLAW